MEDGLRGRHPRAAAAVALVGLIPALVAAAATADGRAIDPLLPLLAAGAAASNILDVRFEGRLWVSGSFLCCLLAAVMLGPSAGAFVALASEIIAWGWRRFSFPALAINCVGTVVPTWLAGLILAALAPYVGSQGIDFDVTLTVVACLDLAANIGVVSCLMALHEDVPLLKHIQAYWRLLPFLGANVVLLVAISEAYRSVGIAAVGFLVTCMLVFTFVVRLVVDAREHAQELEQLAASRGRLAAEALDADERARRELASQLHDDALQSLLAARQDLEDASLGDANGITRAEMAVRESVAKLRDAIFEVHPAVLDSAGLQPAIRAVAERHARRAGFRWHLSMQPETEGLNDQLVFSLVRELIANASRHAAADNVWIGIEVDESSLCLIVRDDGRGFSTTDLAEAVRLGHIGLASCEERVEALGGKFELEPELGAGTEICIELPVAGMTAQAKAAGASPTPAGLDA